MALPLLEYQQQHKTNGSQLWKGGPERRYPIFIEWRMISSRMRAMGQLIAKSSVSMKRSNSTARLHWKPDSQMAQLQSVTSFGGEVRAVLRDGCFG